MNPGPERGLQGLKVKNYILKCTAIKAVMVLKFYTFCDFL
jgi:hypothetical protein